MDFDNSSCSVCNSDKINIVSVIEKNSLTKHGVKRFIMPIAVCSVCGFSFVHPTPSAKELIAIHKDVFYPNWGDNDAIVRHSKELCKLVCGNAVFPAGAKVLEIGCGEGNLLRAFREKGFECYGLELREEIDVELLHKEDITIYKSDFQNSYFNNIFDLVVMDNVLEHIPNPIEILMSVKEILSSEGCLVIAVPYLTNKSEAIFMPEHVNFFTPVSLDNVCRNCGFVPLLAPDLNREVSMYKVSAQPRSHDIINCSEYSLHAVNSCVQRMAAFVRLVRDGLQGELNRLAQEGKTVIFYGAGSYALNLMENLELNPKSFLGFADSDSRKQAAGLATHKVFEPDDLPALNPSAVVICTENPFFVKEIKSRLSSLLSGCEIISMLDLRELLQ